LDATSGAVLWGPVDAGQAYSLAMDAGRIYTLGWDTNMFAFDAATGHPFWQSMLIRPPYGGMASAPPTAYRGIVYAAVSNSVMAVDGATGSILWNQTVWGGDISAPTVSDQGVFASFFCSQNYAFDRITGTTIWHDAGTCSGGQGATPVLSGG